MGIALLAPVPCVHLKDALATCAARGKVAFGTGCWQLFHEIDQQYGADLPVLIYASVGDRRYEDFHEPGRATLAGRLLGYRVAVRGLHPDPTCRPPSTLKMDTPTWACFWEAADLAPLAKPDQVPLRKLTALGQKTPLERVPI
jgi:hypothetical protein